MKLLIRDTDPCIQKNSGTEKEGDPVSKIIERLWNKWEWRDWLIDLH